MTGEGVVFELLGIVLPFMAVVGGLVVLLAIIREVGR